MLKKILLMVSVCLMLLTVPVLAADNGQYGNDSQDNAYNQSDECPGGCCTWRR